MIVAAALLLYIAFVWLLIRFFQNVHEWDEFSRSMFLEGRCEEPSLAKQGRNIKKHKARTSASKFPRKKNNGIIARAIQTPT